MAQRYDYTPADLALLTDELRLKVESGEAMIAHPSTWEYAERPVVRNCFTKSLVKGSGKIKGSKNAAVASKETGFTRRRGYRALSEEYLPEDLKDSPNAILSFRELTERLIDACNGSPQKVKCQHEGCGEYHLVAFKKDANVLFKLWENRVGRATETADINVNSQSLAIVLNERLPITSLEVHTIDPGEQFRRKELIEGQLS